MCYELVHKHAIFISMRKLTYVISFSVYILVGVLL